MEFGPGIQVPGLFGPRVIFPVAIVLVYLVLYLGPFALYRTLYRLRGRLWYRKHRRKAIQVLPAGDRSSRPSKCEPRTVDEVCAVLDDERTRWRWEKRQFIIATGPIPVFEEFAFRGVPLLVGTILTGPASIRWWLILGTAIWAYGHADGGPWDSWRRLILFVRGLVLAYLWLIGIWWFAVLLHAGNNAVLCGWSLLNTWGRLYHRDFRVGDEFTVTLDEDGRGNQAWYATVLSQPGLRVVGGVPGETVRIRVARNDGLAYVIDRVVEIIDVN